MFVFVSHRSSLEFLATYLQLYTLPEKVQPVSPLGIAEPNTGSYPLRHQLFNWLMPVNEEADSTNEPLAFWASKTTSRYLRRFVKYCISNIKSSTKAWGYSIVDTTGRLHPKGVPLSGWSKKGWEFTI